MKAVLLALCGLAVAGCTAPPSGSLEEAGQVDGGVIGPLLDPFGNVTVRLLPLGLEDRSSPLGGFTFRGVPPGTYTVAVDIPGTFGDQETVVVRGGKVTRIILQVHPLPPPDLHVSSLKMDAYEALALPGGSCGACAWEREYEERPEAVVVEAVWKARQGGGGHALVDLWDGNGVWLDTLAAAGDGEVHRLEVPGAELPAGPANVRVTVRFAEDLQPEPAFEMQTFLRYHYLE